MEDEKKKTPPYLSVSKLIDALDILSRKNHEKVTVIIFESNGFSKLEARMALSLLKFLGIIREDGTATDLMQKIRLTGDERKKGFEEAVRTAYKELFETIDEPQNLSSERLDNAFLAHYPHLSHRVLKGVKPIFLKLCEMAGLREEGTPIARTPKPRTEKAVKKEKKVTPSVPVPPKFSRDYDFHIPIVEEKMYIEIPEKLHHRSLHEDELNNDLRALVKKAREFAEKYIPKDEKPDSGESGGSS